MDTLLKNRTKEEQRTVICFLHAEGVSPADIHKECLPNMDQLIQ